MALTDTPEMRLLRRIEANTHELIEQTLPRMPQLYAAGLALLIVTLGDYLLKTQDIPVLSETYEDITDAVGNNAATLGMWINDVMGHVDRSTPNITAVNAIRGLDSLQTCRIMVTLRGRESSHNYRVVNQYGYMGAYQFGASALATVGLINTHAVQQAHPKVRRGRNPQHQEFLLNTNHWIGSNYSHFLKSPSLQDNAFIDLANVNVNVGFNARALNRSNPERIAGYIAAAHLKGSKAANSWYLRGKDSKDGNGTRTSDYAALGESAISKRVELCGDKSYLTDLLAPFRAKP